MCPFGTRATPFHRSRVSGTETAERFEPIAYFSFFQNVVAVPPAAPAALEKKLVAWRAVGAERPPLH